MARQYAIFSLPTPFFVNETRANVEVLFTTFIDETQAAVVPVIPATIIPPRTDGAGEISGGPYGPAFPRKSVRELYRQLPEPQVAQTTEQVAEQTEQSAQAAILQGPSPLPIMMDLGLGRQVMVGMAPSLTDALEQQILADDEDAIVAILLAAS